MNRVFDRCELVFTPDNNGAELIHHWLTEIHDFDDYIEISTDVVIEGIHRGWIGDMTFNFQGHDLLEPWEDIEARGLTKLENVLCSGISFNTHEDEAIRWTYKFLKY